MLTWLISGPFFSKRFIPILTKLAVKQFYPLHNKSKISWGHRTKMALFLNRYLCGRSPSCSSRIWKGRIGVLKSSVPQLWELCRLMSIPLLYDVWFSRSAFKVKLALRGRWGLKLDWSAFLPMRTHRQIFISKFEKFPVVLVARLLQTVGIRLLNQETFFGRCLNGIFFVFRFRLV